MSVLDVAGLEMRRDARLVVRDVTFAADRGDRIALMGASGAGKTSVLRAIAGLDVIAGGAVTVDGWRVSAGSAGRGPARALHRRVGMVFQFHHLFAHMTALQNVWLAPVHVHRESRADAERRAKMLLDTLGVADRASALPHELSGGEAQRVAIARALAVTPAVLLMDEPTASLDPARRDELAASVRRLSADGTTLLIATHDAGFVRGCADRVLLMEHGRIVRDGPVTAVLS